MKYHISLIVISVLIGLGLAGQWGAAQQEGFIPVKPSAPLQEMLPPEAVYEGTQVRHVITSTQENLHLLAGYYYGNPRLWKKIYQQNRDVIANPNRLPVGQTLRIEVGEGWKPKFAYQDWFRLATRNGQWASGQQWQRARRTAAAVVTPTPVETPADQSDEPVAPTLPESTELVEPTEPMPQPAESVPAAEQTGDEAAREEQAESDEPAPAEATPAEEVDEDEAPAF